MRPPCHSVVLQNEHLDADQAETGSSGQLGDLTSPLMTVMASDMPACSKACEPEATNQPGKDNQAHLSTVECNGPRQAHACRICRPIQLHISRQPQVDYEGVHCPELGAEVDGQALELCLTGHACLPQCALARLQNDTSIMRQSRLAMPASCCLQSTMSIDVDGREGAGRRSAARLAI